MYFYLQIFSKKKKMKVDPGLDFISELIGVASWYLLKVHVFIFCKPFYNFIFFPFSFL